MRPVARALGHHAHVCQRPRRGPRARAPISRPVASCACSTRRTLCAAFARQRRLSVGIAIERHAPLDQLANVAGSVLAPARRPPLVAQAVAGSQRVGAVQRRAYRRDRAAAAMPPWAYPVLLSVGPAFVRIRTSPAPSSSAAARSPAMPLPDHDEIGPQLHQLLSYQRIDSEFGCDPSATSERRAIRRRRLQQPHGRIVRRELRAFRRRHSPLHLSIVIEPGAATRLGELLDEASFPVRDSWSPTPRSGGCTARPFAGLPGIAPILLPDGERFKNAADRRRASTTALIDASADRAAPDSSPSAAASSATSPASRRPPICAASRSCTCRRRCWRRSTARSAARSASTTRSART